MAIDATAIGTTASKNIVLQDGAVGTTAVNVSLNEFQTATGSGGFTGGTVGAGAGAFTITGAGINGNAAVTITAATTDTVDTLVQKANDAFAAASGGAAGFKAENVGGQLKITSGFNTAFTVAGTVTGTGLTAAAAATTRAVRTADEMVSLISNTAALKDKVRATNDGGKLRIENLSTESLKLTGVGATGLDAARQV
jgi:hypothetical protein